MFRRYAVLAAMPTGLMAGLLCWLLLSAAFIPGVTGEDRPAEQKILVALDITDGSHIVGTPEFATLDVQTSFGNVAIPLQRMNGVSIRDDHETATLHLSNGDKLTGVLGAKSLRIKTLFGPVSVDMPRVKEISVSDADFASGRGMVLWNKLGSKEEIEKSEVGPGASISGRGVSFVPGRFGNGFTSGDGKSGPNFGPWEKINPAYERAGTVEFWWKPARPFDDGNAAPDELFVCGNWQQPWIVPIVLMYRWRESNHGMGGFDFQVLANDQQQHYLYTGKKAPFKAGDWVHVAFVWDMDGLPRNREARYGVYVDGKYYPVTDANDPKASINCAMAKPEGAYFALGYYDADANNQMNGVMDNVKVWNCAKTDFSDRHREGR